MLVRQPGNRVHAGIGRTEGSIPSPGTQRNKPDSHLEERAMNVENEKWSWWPWVLAAAAGSAAGIGLAALFVWVVGL